MTTKHTCVFFGGWVQDSINDLHDKMIKDKEHNWSVPAPENKIWWEKRLIVVRFIHLRGTITSLFIHRASALGPTIRPWNSCRSAGGAVASSSHLNRRATVGLEGGQVSVRSEMEEEVAAQTPPSPALNKQTHCSPCWNPSQNAKPKRARERNWPAEMDRCLPF